ncbi:gap junction Cx32.2 protein-like [Corythoichthys intestinalis]|uniref:gap junction Cx32.2 protein-like n=1 Tax=Corythoichthys intestinalis TaxID=161448 RepID=UPI0025A57E1A|nr:gap junction Cx32.2 protein-like [Corythoichthys intestinalis]XP_057679044.1 gap junction Cx32.2 protein-like [Corythoichthys intestinalis]XP_061806825.1 gap junction Cx32.2 protein-like [Nerophis lumbriciformis]
MSDWSYLSKLLHKVQAHSTVVGKIWMSVLFLFRIFVLGAAADNVWGDELSEFYCDSMEPGCKHSCYNWMFPMSYVHYWVLQITFVSTPTLVYLGHAVLIIHREKKLLERGQSKINRNGLKKPKYTDERGKVQIKGILFYTYMTQLVFKIILEIGFTIGQFYVFGPLFIVPSFHCKNSPPCAFHSGSLCYISRPTEKTIFIFFMLAVSGISVLLNVVEIVYLLYNRNQSAKKQLEAQPHALHAEQCTPTRPPWEATRNQYGGYPLLPLNSQAITHITSEDSHIHSE